jgi:hypothetical protein
MDRVKVSTFGGNVAQTKSYLIPTYTIRSRPVWAKAGRTKAHARISKTLQDDLVTKMRAAGYSDPTAFSDGILRVGFAVNDMIVAEIKKER